MKPATLLKVSRVEAITDGVFATSMTILVFSVQLPPETSLANLPSMLSNRVFETILMYAGSFIILGTLWVASNILLGFLTRVNRQYMWVNILYLIPAGIVPFSTELIIQYPDSPWSISFYVGNLLVANILQIILWRCGDYYSLYNSSYKECVRLLINRRMCVPPMIYLTSLIIAHWHTRLAFAILLLQPIFNIIPGRIDHYISKRELGFK